RRWILAELERIPVAELSPTEQITHALLGARARQALEWLSYPAHQLSAFIHLGPGVAFSIVEIVGAQPFRNESDYRAWFRRVSQFPSYLASVEGVMRDGAAAGRTTPRVLVERALAQLEGLAPEDMSKSTLWRPIARMPASIDADTRVRLATDYRRILN